MFFPLVLITALFMLIPFLRLYGVVGAVILFYFYTQLTLILLGVLLLAAGLAFLYLHRRNSNAH